MASVPDHPSYTVLLDPSSLQSRVIFGGSGHHHFAGAHDIDGDGRSELILTGINSLLGRANVAAAVRVSEDFFRRRSDGPGLSYAVSPDLEGLARNRQWLAWYVFLPQGLMIPGPPGLEIDEKRSELVIHHVDGERVVLGFDGFLAAQHAGLAVAERQEARFDAYSALFDSRRLAIVGELDLAITETERARELASRIADSNLEELATREKARVLALASRPFEAEAILTELVATSEYAPEIAFDAAVAFHLSGDLERAVAWYRRGLGRHSHFYRGKSKHYFLEGAVFALCQMGRYQEAVAETDRYAAAYPQAQFDQVSALYRGFALWRAGSRPPIVPASPHWNADVLRYLPLELRLPSETEPLDLLAAVDAEIPRSSETLGPLLSLRAELLARTGRKEEASEVALAAWHIVASQRRQSTIAAALTDLVRERRDRLVLLNDPKGVREDS
jgi:tetratricopeptide (TPR) repeat protein